MEILRLFLGSLFHKSFCRTLKSFLIFLQMSDAGLTETVDSDQKRWRLWMGKSASTATFQRTFEVLNKSFFLIFILQRIGVFFIKHQVSFHLKGILLVKVFFLSKRVNIDPMFFLLQAKTVWLKQSWVKEIREILGRQLSALKGKKTRIQLSS